MSTTNEQTQSHPGAAFSQAVSRGRVAVEKAKFESSRLTGVARFGYAAKGIVYGLIGLLAIMAAFGAGGATTGSKGAISQLGDNALGDALLILLTIGLGCYAIWRFISAFADAENKGSDARGIAARCGYLVSAFAHVGLACTAYLVLTGSGTGGGGTDVQSMTAKLMAAPFGPWLVMGVGLLVAATGLMQFKQAIQGDYRWRFDLDGFAASQRHWVHRAAILGLCSRGFVFLTIAFFLVMAGYQGDSGDTKGVGGVLDTLAQNAWLLGVVALGLFCYGLYCWVITFHGRFGRTTT